MVFLFYFVLFFLKIENISSVITLFQWQQIYPHPIVYPTAWGALITCTVVLCIYVSSTRDGFFWVRRAFFFFFTADRGKNGGSDGGGA